MRVAALLVAGVLLAVTCLLAPVGVASAQQGGGRIVSGATPVLGGGPSAFVFSGGSSEQLLMAAGCPRDGAVFWTGDGRGGFAVWIPATTVTVVNEAWDARFGGGLAIPPDTAVIGRCGLTMAEVYRRTQQSLTRPGEVYRASLETVDPDGGRTADYSASGSPASTATLWVAAARAAARREVTRNGGGFTTVYTGQSSYTLSSSGDIAIGRAAECPGASVAVSALLDCPNAVFDTIVFDANGQPRTTRAHPEVSIERGQFEGAPAIVIVAVKREQPFRAGPRTETRTFYLDPGTFLPRAIEVADDQPPRTLTRFTHQFVAAGSLPATLFEPTALRDARPDPEAKLRQPPVGYTLYWLGARYGGGPDAPALNLWRIDRYDGGNEGWDAGQVTLDYTPASDPFGQRLLLRLTEYTRATWERLTPTTHGPPDRCWTQQEIALPEGRAVIFSGFNWPDNVPPGPENACPTERARDRFFAHVYLGQTVVVVQPWDWPEQSRDGLETLVRALRARTP